MSKKPMLWTPVTRCRMLLCMYSLLRSYGSIYWCRHDLILLQSCIAGMCAPAFPPPPPLPRTVTKVLLTTIGTETRLPPGGLLKVIPQPGWSSLLSNLSEIKPMPMPVCSESPFTDYTMTQHVKDTLRQIAPCHTYQEWNGWGSIDKHSGSVASLNGLLQFKLDIFG